MSKIQRFKCLEEAEFSQWCFECDDIYYERVAELWRFADCLLPRKYPREIFRYQTLEEANRASEQWNVSNAFFREDVKIKTATAEARYKLKKDSVRPKDQNEAIFLKRKIEYLKRK